MNQLHPFVETISVVSAIGIVFTAVIIVLTLFLEGFPGSRARSRKDFPYEA